MQDLIITSGGERLAARLAGGIASAGFTKVRASAADYSAWEKDDIKALNGLSDVCQTAAVSNVRFAGDSTVEVTAAMDNLELESGYYVRTIGLYAEDEDKNDVLFAVSVEPRDPFYMPPFAGKTVSGVTYKLMLKVSGSENIRIGASSDVYASSVQLADEVRRINERIDSLSFSEEINEHNVSESSHPALIEKLDAFGRRLELVELAAGDNVAANPFSVTFGTLDGITADGVWNVSGARLEF